MHTVALTSIGRRWPLAPTLPGEGSREGGPGEVPGHRRVAATGRHGGKDFLQGFLGHPVCRARLLWAAVLWAFLSDQVTSTSNAPPPSPLYKTIESLGLQSAACLKFYANYRKMTVRSALLKGPKNQHARRQDGIMSWYLRARWRAVDFFVKSAVRFDSIRSFSVPFSCPKQI